MMSTAFVDWIIFGSPLVFLLTLLCADLYIKFVIRKRPGMSGYPTITTRIQTLSSEYIAIPFMTGLIIGLITAHLFGQF
jgi:hypothetical protein